MRIRALFLLSATTLTLVGCDSSTPTEHAMVAPHPASEPPAEGEPSASRMDLYREIGNSYHPNASNYLKRVSILERFSEAGESSDKPAGLSHWPIDEDGFLDFDSEQEMYDFFENEVKVLAVETFVHAGPQPGDGSLSYVQSTAEVEVFPKFGWMTNSVKFHWQRDNLYSQLQDLDDSGLIPIIPRHKRVTTIEYPNPITLNCVWVAQNGWIEAWGTHYYSIPSFAVKVRGVPANSPAVNLSPEFSPPDKMNCFHPPPTPPTPPTPDDPCDEMPGFSSTTDPGMASLEDCGSPGEEICEWTEWGFFIWIDGQWWLITSWLEYECWEEEGQHLMVGTDAAASGQSRARSMKVVIVPDAAFSFGEGGSAIRRHHGPPVIFLRESAASQEALWEACRGISRWEDRMEDPSYFAPGLVSLRASKHPPSRGDAEGILKRARTSSAANHDGVGRFPTLLVSAEEMARLGC